MTSSSMSCIPSFSSQRKFDVFISFRGEDTRENFTSHLYLALRRKKIDTFIDNRLERGEEISAQLLQAIEGSKLSLVVFSEDYGSSKWCLDELVKIIECKNTIGQLVVPIFYCVDPSNVRHQRGSYAAAFTKHESVFKDKLERVQKWRSALLEAANLSGWDSKVVRPESELVEEVVKDALMKLNRISSKLEIVCSSVVKGFVGIDSRVEQVMTLLDTNVLDFRVVGVWGMGGIGKTTVAEAVFHRNSNKFEGSCFLRNIKEAEEKDDLVRLRDKLLSQILEENLHIGTPQVQPDFIIDRLRRKKLLIVLDNVSDTRQLEILFGGPDLFSAGSRVIVTTRDKQVLNSFNITRVYHVERLNDDEALLLFRQHAFPPDCLTASYDGLVKRVVHYAQGVPLALKILGSSLCGKDTQHWESALNKLKRVPNLKIRDVLKTSYEGLADEEIKDIFLDIACFFKGEDIDQVTRILDACYLSVFSGINVLIDKSLVEVSRNKIEMHDLVQELGWHIVNQESKVEPGRRSRLWVAEDVLHLLKRNTGTETVRGIFMGLSKSKEVRISPDVFEKMYNLKLLKFSGSTGTTHGVQLPDGLKWLPDQLRYLCWHGYPLNSLPSAFCPENLVELDLSYSNVNRLWDGKQDLINLKIINLVESKKLTEIPELSQVPNLENLQLSGCESLVTIPSSVKHLKKLTELNLRDCKNLRNLASIINLRALVTLDLNGCSNLAKFPEISRNVKYLSLSRTAIEEFPSSLEHLSSLETLRLDDCMRLKHLPDNLRELHSLETLFLRGCKNITSLPELPHKVEQLYMEEMGIEAVPESICHLHFLQALFIRDCKRLRIIPSTVWRLKSLESFYLSGCSMLESIPEISESVECLSSLELSGTAIKTLPTSIQRLVGLEHLILDNCRSLSILPEELFSMKNLQYITAHGTSIKELPCFTTDMKVLNCLYISGHDGRKPVSQSLPSLSKLRYLTSLRLKDLSIVQIPEDIGCLASLEKLDLSGNDFETMPSSIKQLSRLERMDLSYCRRLQSLPELRHGLQNLNAHDCTSLRTVSPDLKVLTVGYNGMYIFTNCFKLDERARSNILSTEQLRFQHKLEGNKKGQRHCLVCLPGSELPQCFSHRSRQSTLTVNLPSNWYHGDYTGFALCIIVKFIDCLREFDFSICCAYRFESRDDECHERSSFFHLWRGFEIQDRCVSISKFSPRVKVQHRFIGSDHIFLLCDDSMYQDAVQTRAETSNLYHTVSFEFSVVDSNTGECLECCRVEESGCYMMPSPSKEACTLN